MKKKAVIFILVVLTFLNISAFLLPTVLSACACIRGGEIFCTGNCCGGATQCDCYDWGTDNCIQAN